MSRFFSKATIARAAAWGIGTGAWTAFRLFKFTPPWLTTPFARPCGRMIRRMMGLAGKGSLLDKVEQVLGPFPGPDAEDSFWRKRLEHLGLSVFEPFHLMTLDDAGLRESITVEGEEHLQAAREAGKGAILFLNHLGNPGALVASLGGRRGYRTAFAGNRIVAHIAGCDIPLDRVESLVRTMFARGRVERVPLGKGLPIRLTEILAAGGFFGMFMDFPVVEKHNRIIPFGRAAMNLNLGPALLAMRHRVPVLAVTTLRTAPNRHRVIVSPLELPEKGGDLDDRAAGLIAAGITRMLEPLQAHPDQWWPWEHAPITPMPGEP